jgi:hypothetical protein
MKQNIIQKNYKHLEQLAKSDNDLLYTEKEIKMHVFGPKELADYQEFQSFDPSNFPSPDCGLTFSEGKDFYENGFCIVKSAVSSSLLLGEARKYINSQYHTWLAMSKRQDDWRMHFLLPLRNEEDFVDSPIEHAPIINILLRSPLILGKLTMLMGSKPAGIFYNQVAYRTPITNKSTKLMEYTVGAEYHIDGQANEFGTRFPDPWTVLICIALVDIDSLNMGNFTIWPGTHASRNWSNYPEEKRIKSLPHFENDYHVALKAGDIVLGKHCLFILSFFSLCFSRSCFITSSRWKECSER